MKKTENQLSLMLSVIMLIFNMNIMYSQTKKATTKKTISSAAQKTVTKYASLAIDKKNGFYYGWATDYTDLESAEYNALNECIKKGGNCTIALNFSGTGCGVYKTVDGNNTGYGWGFAKTKESADAIATKECLLRSDGNSPTNSVWGCNSANAGALQEIFNALSEIKQEEEQEKLVEEHRKIEVEKAKILENAKNECKEEYKTRVKKAERYVEECDAKIRETSYDKDKYGDEYKIWHSKAFHADQELDHIKYHTPCDHLDENGYVEEFNKSEEIFFEKSRNDLALEIKRLNQESANEDQTPAYQAPQLMSITEQLGNLEKIMQESQKQIAANQAARTATSSTRNAPARREYDTSGNSSSNSSNNSNSSNGISNSSSVDKNSNRQRKRHFKQPHKSDGVYYSETEACENAKSSAVNAIKSYGGGKILSFSNCNCRELIRNKDYTNTDARDKRPQFGCEVTADIEINEYSQGLPLPAGAYYEGETPSAVDYNYNSRGK